MPTDDTKSLARQFIKAWNAGQRAVVDDLAAPDLTVAYPHFPDPLEGPAAFKEMLAQTHHFFPDLMIDVDAALAEGHQAVVHWRYRGTFQNGEMFDVEAAGQSIEVSGMTRFQIEDGAVQAERGIVDNLGLMQQLGAFSP